MTPERSSPPSAAQPALAAYSILCFTALMGMVLVLMEDERELTWLLLLAGIAAIGVVARSRAAPPLLLLGLAALELYHRIIWSTFYRARDWQTTGFTDAVLCAAVLAYSAGQYRLLSLKHAVFPIDTRRPPIGAGGGRHPSIRGNDVRLTCRNRGKRRFGDHGGGMGRRRLFVLAGAVGCSGAP